jgi:hypothetical protein
VRRAATFTSYEGLFLRTGRLEAGRSALLDAAEDLREALDAPPGRRTASGWTLTSALLWAAAVDRHTELTGDADLLEMVKEPVSALAAAVRSEQGLWGYRAGAAARDVLLRTSVPTGATRKSEDSALSLQGLWVNALHVMTAKPKPATAAGAQYSRALRQSALQVTRRLRACQASTSADRAAAGVVGSALLALATRHGPTTDAALLKVVLARRLTRYGISLPIPTRDPTGAATEPVAAVVPGLIGPLAVAAARCGTPIVCPFDGLREHLTVQGAGHVTELLAADSTSRPLGRQFAAVPVAQFLRAWQMKQHRPEGLSEQPHPPGQ